LEKERQIRTRGDDLSGCNNGSTALIESIRKVNEDGVMFRTDAEVIAGERNQLAHFV
jgi:hypothetical protein